MNNFCIKEDQVLKASVAHLYPDFPSVLPPGHSDNPGLTLGPISRVSCIKYKKIKYIKERQSKLFAHFLKTV